MSEEKGEMGPAQAQVTGAGVLMTGKWPAAPAAPSGARVVTIARSYHFAAGQHGFYGAREAEMEYCGPGAPAVVGAGFQAGDLRAFAEGRSHELPPIDVLRVIIYEWLRGGGR